MTTAASAAQLHASFERRTWEWQYQLFLAGENASIADQQIVISKDDVDIASQGKTIADLQQSNAKDALEFLTNAFTDPDLYGWMGGILQSVYSYFLRHATVMARLAANQLAFERQQVPPAFIQTDYWAPAPDLASTGAGTTTDRKGLTGAERLLQDIAQLDQYAFLTDTRKLQCVDFLAVYTRSRSQATLSRAT